MTEVVEALKRMKDEFARLNDLLQQLDPEKAVEALIKISQLCSCEDWEKAMAYRFLLPPEDKKQVEILRQINHIRMSNFVFHRIPGVNQLFKYVANRWKIATEEQNTNPDTDLSFGIPNYGRGL